MATNLRTAAEPVPKGRSLPGRPSNWQAVLDAVIMYMRMGCFKTVVDKDLIFKLIQKLLYYSKN